MCHRVTGFLRMDPRQLPRPILWGRGANQACGHQSTPRVVIELPEDALIASSSLEARFFCEDTISRE
ncbi:hypothetical protein MRX96_032839 [Rhipicephalus microplus]